MIEQLAKQPLRSRAREKVHSSISWSNMWSSGLDPRRNCLDWCWWDQTLSHSVSRVTQNSKKPSFLGSSIPPWHCGITQIPVWTLQRGWDCTATGKAEWQPLPLSLLWTALKEHPAKSIRQAAVKKGTTISQINSAIFCSFNHSCFTRMGWISWKHKPLLLAEKDNTSSAIICIQGLVEKNHAAHLAALLIRLERSNKTPFLLAHNSGTSSTSKHSFSCFPRDHPNRTLNRLPI